MLHLRTALLLLIALVAYGEDPALGLGALPATAAQITLAGDVTGAGSANTVAKVNGVALGTMSATAGKVVVGDGSTISSQTLSGDGSINGSGVLTLSLPASRIASGQVAVARGGTGVDASAAANGAFLIGNGTGFTLATLTAGSGFSLTNAAGSVTLQPKVYVLGSDASAHSITGTLTETVLKTYSITAATTSVPVNSVLVVRQIWSFTGSTNSKQLRVYLGSAGQGKAGTLSMQASTTTAGNVIFTRAWPIYCRATNSQVAPNASNSGDGFANNAVATASAVDMTANWEIALSGQLANTGETIQLEASVVELQVP